MTVSKSALKHYPSPLTYLGSKAKMSDFVSTIVDTTGSKTLVETCLGGGNLGLKLLLSGKIDTLICNDYDRSIFSFWHAVINYADDFIDVIKNIDLTAEEFYKQKEYYNINKDNNVRYDFNLAVAVFYLNRLSFLGNQQTGSIQKVTGTDVDSELSIQRRTRYLARELNIERIKQISSVAHKIQLFSLDINYFIYLIKKHYANNINKLLWFIDPPYVKAGKQCYNKYFDKQQHIDLCNTVDKELHDQNYLITYDLHQDIIDLYKTKEVNKLYSFDLRYVSKSNQNNKELLISNLDIQDININIQSIK